MLLITQIAFHDDPARITSQIHKLCDELDTRAKNHVSVFPKGTKRILNPELEAAPHYRDTRRGCCL